ncbi:sigma-70 family RNA polymerase sigma factor [Blastopirellula sp. JC732]|uniref:Sigma-70 family RNA polymerase sigma factor n=1 Tax=Blastopirellula sediminis TaxID=2894196 RepID=A0A9X1SHR3_9BACT|nr:sigma-70 family RNA polymerase sigma factor [Blastopirellula sediminis]MCC9605983.1 sigma-70 family RNA polymerase sigma factor [Blastopirellula sediminis]MCC9630718.1 sigma-70 family RNA polymerase sigma factor [Blastopirellula sediminis]
MSESPNQQPTRRSGISREIGQLLDRYADALTLYARQLCSDPEDAVQCAFVKLTRQSSLPTDCVAWLYRVVRNEALTQSRGERRRRDREQTFASLRDGWFEASGANSFDAVAASEALERLTQLQREIVTARIWGGLTFREIAQLLTLSPSSIYREYQQAIAYLQTELDEPCPNRSTPNP